MFPPEPPSLEILLDRFEVTMMEQSAPLEHDWFPKPLPQNVSIGERSWCYSSFSCLHYHSCRPVAVRIGHDTGIYHGTFFNLGPEGEIQIGNYCTLVGAIISTNAQIELRDYTFIAHEVVLADSFAAAPFKCSGSQRAESHASSKVISVGENCWIGARAVLLAGAHLGEGVIVGAAAIVDFAVPAFAVVAGNPARIVGWTNGH
jgi:acetyltransferase-like isoleucine patch superfamily enzyme